MAVPTIKLINLILYVIQVTAFASAIIFRYKPKEKFYIRNTFIYLFISLLSSVLIEFWPQAISNKVVTFFLVFEILFLSGLFYQEFRSKYNKVIFLLPALFTLLLTGVHLGIIKQVHYSGILFGGNFYIFTLTLIYFKLIFSTVTSIPLTKTPLFWIVSGIMICFGISLPVYAVGWYAAVFNPQFIFKLAEKNRDVLILLSGVIQIGYIIMFIFFIKGFLCKIRLIK